MSTTRNITVREALREAMNECMRADPSVFLMGEEVALYQGAYKISQGMLDEFGPQRVVDTPISEYGFTGIAVGAAFKGLRPVVEFMSFNFSMQAIDHIINSASKTLYMSGGTITCPIVFRGPNGAAASVAAQHSQCYASWFAHCPGLKVVAPYDAQSAKGLLKSAIMDPNPVIFLENEILYGMQFPIDDDAPLPSLDKALVRKKGKDISIVSFSFMMHACLKAADILSEKYHIDAEIIDLCSLRPLDYPCLITSLQKTHRMVVVEEGWPVCGIGAEISAYMMEHAFDALDAPICRVAGLDVPLPYAKNLERMCIPQVEHVVQAVLKTMHREKMEKYNFL